MANYAMVAKVEGLDEMIRAFNQAPKVVIKELSGALEDAGASVQSKAVQYAPHRYGPLQGSIHKEGPEVRGNDVIVKIGTNLEYAKYQEFGTGVYGPKGTPITPKAKKFLAFQVGGQWVFTKKVLGVRPKYFMKRAKEESQGLLEANMRRAVGNILAFLARG